MSARTCESAGGGIDVSFAVACYNAGPYLRPAVESALEQRDVTLEVLIVDDGSSDGSDRTAQALAEADARVRLFRTPANAGPAGARNLALREMRGAWFAVLDSDDLIAPERSQRLLAIAGEAEADIVADNLLEFAEGLCERPMFDFGVADGWRELGIEEYFARSRLFGGEPGPGFLKPMIRRDAIARVGLAYNESLRIGEDDELIVRALAAGCRYAVTGRAMYRYRKHPGSISHRLSLANAENMVAAEEGLRALIGPEMARTPAYRGRRRALARGHAFVKSIERLKAHDVVGAAAALIARPGAAMLYRMPIENRLRRLWPGKSKP